MNIKKGPGKADRRGISLTKLFAMFPDNATAEKWVANVRWGDTPSCPHCGSVNVQSGCKHKTMPYRCREKGCAKKFSVKTGTVMQSSSLDYQTWAIAIYLVTTSLKSVSSMKLHRDLDITQKSAMASGTQDTSGAAFQSHQAEAEALLKGPVEQDETYFGGKRKNMSNSQRKGLAELGRGSAGKTAVVGLKDRESNEVRAKVVQSTDAETLIGFTEENVEQGATVYTDEATTYNALPTLVNQYEHETVRHSVSEYVRADVSTNGIESFWSMLKRSQTGTFHKMSPKHLSRYIGEFVGRHNIREADTLAQMQLVYAGLQWKRLRYKDLTADNGLDSGARA